MTKLEGIGGCFGIERDILLFRELRQIRPNATQVHGSLYYFKFLFFLLSNKSFKGKHNRSNSIIFFKATNLLKENTNGIILGKTGKLSHKLHRSRERPSLAFAPSAFGSVYHPGDAQ